MLKFLLKHYIFLKGAPRSIKISALVTLAGIALSIAVLVISLSVSSGFESAYKRSILDFNAHIVLLKDGGEISDYRDLMSDLKQFEGVRGVSPFIYRETMFVNRGAVKGAVLKGIDPDLMRNVSRISLKDFGPREPALLEGAPPTVHLGSALAAKLGIDRPMQVNILVGDNKFQKVLAVGTFESGLYDYDSQFALMPIEQIQKVYEMNDEVTGVEMKIEDPDDAKDMVELIEGEFGYPYQLTSWETLNRPIFEAVKLEKIMFAILVGILVLVAMFNIIGTLILRMIYKTKEISILSAIGLKRFFIRVIFTFHGLMLGVAGILAGFAGGLAGVYLIGRYKMVQIEPEIYFLSSLPMKVEWDLLAVIFLASVLISLAVSFVASGKIAALDILDGLKES